MSFKEQLKGMFTLTIGTTLGAAALNSLSGVTGAARRIADTGVSIGILGMGASVAKKMFKW